MGISDIHIDVMKQVMIHVMPIGIRVRRKKADVLVQIESTAQRKIQLLLLVHSDKVPIDGFHGLAGGEAKDQMWVGSEFMGNYSGHERSRRIFIGLDDDFHVYWNPQLDGYSSLPSSALGVHPGYSFALSASVRITFLAGTFSLSKAISSAPD